jgi:hypothetical protein
VVSLTTPDASFSIIVFITQATVDTLKQIKITNVCIFVNASFGQLAVSSTTIANLRARENSPLPPGT